MIEEQILLKREGELAWLTFNRPESRNALTFAMYERLSRILRELREEKDLRVLILTGAGRDAFVAGTEISEFRAFRKAADAIAYEERLESIFGDLEEFPRPTIAMVNGYAVGGGAQMALACDLRVCSPHARFGVPIARTLGNCLSTTGYARLMELVGPSLTKELLFTGRMIGAEEARGLGLVSDVVAGDKLQQHVRELARSIARNAPLTLEVTKTAVRLILARRRAPLDHDLLLKCYLSEDFREGIEAFLGKRRPHWRGR
ncbi:MAG: enoyl-CoA hydratase/isomerase family protein [Acidobacteriota bacterium]